jgi:hypothetical protein
METLTVYMGFDPIEVEAYKVAEYTIRKTTPNVRVVPLRHDWLTMCGLLNRPMYRTNGQLWDVLSDAPMSTEFAISRFLVPLLHQSGMAIFMDCDVVVKENLHNMLPTDPDKAVYCVKHEHQAEEQTKMCGLIQTRYSRKNWSSVMAFNCDHASNRRLRLDHINRWPGRRLHAFDWLQDSEIGEINARWNWLVGVQEEPPGGGAICHFTLGGPWLRGWGGGTHDGIWMRERIEMRQASAPYGH